MHHIWNFSCFLCGNLSTDILENIWNSLYFPSKNKMRNFWDEIWIYFHFSYENQGTDFLTWHINCIYFRYENLSSDFLHEIWNFLCFKYGNLTLDMLLWNTQSLYFLYACGPWFCSIICVICYMSHRNILVQVFPHEIWNSLYFPYQNMRTG